MCSDADCVPVRPRHQLLGRRHHDSAARRGGEPGSPLLQLDLHLHRRGNPLRRGVRRRARGAHLAGLLPHQITELGYIFCGVTLARHVSFTRTCDCRISRLLPHISHISAECVYHVFFPHNLAFSTAILTLFLCFYHLFLLGFVTSTIWLPTERHHPCVRTPVERDGVVGFKQFCTIFPHISAAYRCLCGPHIF